MNSNRPKCILVISDDPARQGALERLLEPQRSLRLVLADTANAVTRLFESEAVDLVLVFPSTEEPSLLEAATRCVSDCEGHLPLVAVIEPDDAEAALAVAAGGANGFVSTADERRLKRILVSQIEQIHYRHEALLAAQRLTEIENRYTLLLDSSSEAIAYIHEGLHIFANPAYLEIFGFNSFDQIEGLSMLDLLGPGPDAADLKQILKSLERDELPDKPLSLEGRHPDGSRFPVVAAFSSARFNGEDCAQLLIRPDHPDADPALAEELNRLKQSDLLTGFFNQAAFMQHLRDEIDIRGDATGLSLLFMSLDQPDKLQARIGIGATDALILGAGRLMAQGSGDTHAMARLRDHIFAVLAETPDPQSAEHLARRIVEHCHGHILEIGDISLPITVSVGVAQGGSGQQTAETLASQAEIALNEALRSGGDAYVRYRPRVSEDVSDDDQAWRERLSHALDHDEIRLMTSPITRMDEDTTMIYEIDSRMRAEGSDEVILPSVFLSAAARVGLAPRMDRDLLRRLAKLIEERTTRPGDAWLVTLSSASISDPDFCSQLENWLRSPLIKANQLIWGLRDFEIEDKLRQAQDFISRFKAFGCRFALTDVGPESNVDAILNYLELAFMRLAPEMVQNLSDNENLRLKLADTVREGKLTATEVIAPRVEHASDLATLWQLGITLVQGEFVREQAAL